MYKNKIDVSIKLWLPDNTIAFNIIQSRAAAVVTEQINYILEGKAFKVKGSTKTDIFLVYYLY